MGRCDSAPAEPRSRVAGVARQQREVDAELGDRPLPLAVQVLVEDQLLVGGDVEPAVGLDLGVELARAPAGIAEREQTAARAGALWQKFIRRAAQVRLGAEDAVKDIYATFVDDQLGSCGELSEWVEGRTWLLEVDDRLDLLVRWGRGKVVDEAQLGSQEYRAKHDFMRDFVKLLHDMGAHEFARQYEWSTCKSQPNCLNVFSTARAIPMPFNRFHSVPDLPGLPDISPGTTPFWTSVPSGRMLLARLPHRHPPR